jgi:MFS family permease
MEAEAVSDQKRILWLTGVGHGLGHAWELVFPAVAIPMAADLGLSFGETLELAFPLYLLFGVGAPLAGYLTDHLGGRRVLLICLTLGGLSGLLLSATSGKVPLMAAFGGLGLAASLYHPAGLGLLSHRFPKKTGWALGINGMAGNVGIALTPVLAGACASLWGWRWAYVLFAVPGLFGALFFFFWGFEDGPEHHEVEKATEKARIDWAAIGLLVFAMMIAGLAYRIHTLVVPALLQERLPGLEAFVASLPGASSLSSVRNLGATFLTSLAYMMGLLGQWMGGKIADSRSLVLSYIGFHLGALPLVLVAAFAFGPALVVVLFLYLFFAFGMQPAENSLVAKMSPPRLRGRAYAAKFVVTFGIGSLGIYVVQWLEPLGGLGASLAASAGLEVLLVLSAGLLWLRLRRTGRSL